MLEISAPTEDDREDIASLSNFSFQVSLCADDVSLQSRLCSYDRGRVVGSASSIDFDQWFGGARIPCAGVCDVAVLPEYRGRGTAASLIGELLRSERERGRAISSLYPSTSSLYRQLGYEFAGYRPNFRAPIADLPVVPASGGEVRLLEEGEEGAVKRCFARYASAHNGPVEASDLVYWKTRLLTQKGSSVPQRTVVVAREGDLMGYASYVLERRKEGGFAGYTIVCKHLFVLTMPALRSLLGYLRRFENSAQELAWYGPMTMGPIGLALQANTFNVSLTLTRWMARVLDVPRALEMRGYPNVEGEVVLTLDDALFPANGGPWSIQASGGHVSVTRANVAPTKGLSIGAFSALYTGFATPDDLVLLGALDEEHPGLELLSALFAGPVPWMPDGF